MKKSLLMLFSFAALFSRSALAQEIKLGDSLLIKFSQDTPGYRVIAEKKDLIYQICIKNISQKSVSVYKELVVEMSGSIFGNADFKLYKKVDGKFERIYYYALPPFSYYYEPLYAKYGVKADSIITLFDPERKELETTKQDTIQYNILKYKYILEPGEYRFQTFLRVNTKYSFAPGKATVEKIEYINSEWYYFSVPKRIEW